jgi:Flp pilus assembly pilin Flp
LKNPYSVVWRLRIWTDRKAQDLVEYALLAGFAAVAAGAIIPGVANDVSEIISKIPGLLPGAGTHGSVR